MMTPSSILIRSSNWLGDAIMTMPAVHAIRQNCPQARIVVLAQTKLHEVWKRFPGIDAVLSVDKSAWKTAALIRKEKFDMVVVFPNSFRSGLEVFLGRVSVRVGYRGHLRSLFLTKAVRKTLPETGIRHQKLDYLALVREAGFKAPDDIQLPEVPPFNPAPLSEPYLVVCPGAEYGPAKRWPAERFAEAAQRIVQKTGWKVILLGAKADIEASADVEKHLGLPCQNLTAKTSLGEFIDYLHHASMVLCNDSGSMHLAAFLKRPAIAIFGSTEQRLTGPLGNSVSILREHVPCSPCFLRKCPIDFRCMLLLDVDRVVAAADKILAKK